MAPAGSLFVVGSGPLIGAHTARLFARNSFTHIALISRSQSKLDKDANFVRSPASSVKVLTYTADVTSQSELTNALNRAITDLGPPEVVLYNAARINHSRFGTYPPEEIVYDFKVPNLGLYTTATVMLPYLQELERNNPAAHPALFVTSGYIIHQPIAPVFSLSMAKAAQATMTKVLAEENKDIVHVALLTVGGEVSVEEKDRNPENIAGLFWKLYLQKKGHWDLEMKCGW